MQETPQTPSLDTRPPNFAKDFCASLVVFLVALPLSMGISIASGVPPIYGIITGIVGGIVVGFLGGSPLLVSGTAAGLTVLVLDIVHQFGLERLGLIVGMAGLLQMLAGRFRLGQIFRAVSPAITEGMLTGIGILIFASQFHVMVDDMPKGSGLHNLLYIPHALWKGLIPMDGTSHHLAAALGVMTIAFIVIWSSWGPQKLKWVPAPLIAILLVTIIANYFQTPVQYITLPPHIFDELQWPPALWTHFQDLFNPAIWGAIIGLMLVASAETLISAAALDQMHEGKRTNFDKELAAQGLGNTVCGLLGVLPMTGVIVRSATNVQAGATTKRSAILHGVWLLLMILLAPGLLQLIPIASLAALLVFTGYKLMKFKTIPTLLKYGGKSEVFIFMATVGTIVVEDLLTGVMVGIVLSLIKLIYVFSHLHIDLRLQPENNATHLYLKGAATFIRLPQLAKALESIILIDEVHIHIDELTYIDHACLELIVNWEKQLRVRDGNLYLDWDTLHLRVHQPGISTNFLQTLGKKAVTASKS